MNVFLVIGTDLERYSYVHAVCSSLDNAMRVRQELEDNNEDDEFSYRIIERTVDKV